jgi:hypothetical protein
MPDVGASAMGHCMARPVMSDPERAASQCLVSLTRSRTNRLDHLGHLVHEHLEVRALGRQRVCWDAFRGMLRTEQSDSKYVLARLSRAAMQVLVQIMKC